MKINLAHLINELCCVDKCAFRLIQLTKAHPTREKRSFIQRNYFKKRSFFVGWVMQKIEKKIFLREDLLRRSSPPISEMGGNGHLEKIFSSKKKDLLVGCCE